jgi:hypothetical protein
MRLNTLHTGAGSIVLKTGPVIEPVKLSVQVFTGRTIGSAVHCLVFYDME